VWWVQYSFRGEKHRESSESPKKAGAVKMLRRRLAEMGRGVLIGPSAERVTFADLMRIVLEDYELKQRMSKPPFGQLRAYFSLHMRALDIARDAVAGYVKHRLATGAAPQTVKAEVGILARAFTLAVEAGHLPCRPKFPLPRVNNARQGFFSDAEVREVLVHLPKYMRPFIESAYITGWRRGELRSLRWTQVDWEMGTLRLERGTTKSGEPRTFPFMAHARLAEVLREQRAMASRFERANGCVCP
jgi:integrase